MNQRLTQGQQGDNSVFSTKINPRLLGNIVFLKQQSYIIVLKGLFSF